MRASKEEAYYLAHEPAGHGGLGGDEGRGEGGIRRRFGGATSAISGVGCLGTGDGGGDQGFVADLSTEHQPDEPRKGKKGDELGAVEATRSSWTCSI